MRLPLLVAALSLAPLACLAAPSFDCLRATIAAEFAICASERLSLMDRMLAARYRELLRDGHSVLIEEMRRRQRIWLQVRDDCGADAFCLQIAYEVRLRELGV